MIMLNINRILQQDRLLRATIGLNQKAFEALLVKFELVYLSFYRLSNQKDNEVFY